MSIGSQPRTHYRLAVTLTLRGPILTAGGEMSEPGIDAPMARDRFGRYMLPFSLIKGKVLDSLIDLFPGEFQMDPQSKRSVPQGPFRDWLGSPSADGTLDPERGRIRFSDFFTKTPGESNNLIERIELDPATGSVGQGKLMMIEAPFRYGEKVAFQGEIDFIATENESKLIKSKLDQALAWTPSYGAFHTVGYGRTESASSIWVKRPASRPKGAPTAGTVAWQLQLDRPLCLVGRKHSQNHFDSLDVISGTVLKGAIARQLQELSGSNERDVSGRSNGNFPKLRQYFEQIRFSEMKPMQIEKDGQPLKPKRPVEPPLSIVTCPLKNEEFQGKYFDVALTDEPRLIYASDDPEQKSGAAPTFLPDWKYPDYKLVRESFGWSPLPRERRTRTAINPETGRAADEQLFSYGLVLPDCGTGNEKQQFVWEGSIRLEGINSIADQKTVSEELAKLLEFGLTGIGKTRAHADVTWLDKPSPIAIESAETIDNVVVITLQTECLMTNPAILQSQGDDVMKNAYADFWAEVSKESQDRPSSLQLERFFARQSLYGGFVSKRVKKNANERYEPFLLTDRGSVFVLRIVNQPVVETLIRKWKSHGLDTPNWAKDRYSPARADGQRDPLWQRCPYVPQNGYGEIAINLKCHFDNRLPQNSTAKEST